jgi:hypothetical protein
VIFNLSKKALQLAAETERNEYKPVACNMQKGKLHHETIMHAVKKHFKTR